MEKSADATSNNQQHKIWDIKENDWIFMFGIILFVSTLLYATIYILCIFVNDLSGEFS